MKPTFYAKARVCTATVKGVCRNERRVIRMNYLSLQNFLIE